MIFKSDLKKTYFFWQSWYCYFDIFSEIWIFKKDLKKCCFSKCSYIRRYGQKITFQGDLKVTSLSLKYSKKIIFKSNLKKSSIFSNCWHYLYGHKTNFSKVILLLLLLYNYIDIFGHKKLFLQWDLRKSIFSLNFHIFGELGKKPIFFNYL